jgi:hypothetical protein
VEATTPPPKFLKELKQLYYPELHLFKAHQVALLMDLKKKLTEKYPDKKQRIEALTHLLLIKLEDLRTYTLSNYMLTLAHATKEFQEFEEIMPSPQQIEELIKKAR